MSSKRSQRASHGATSGALPPVDHPEQQARRAEAIGSVAEPVLIIGDDMNVRWANQAAERSFVGAGQGMVGRPCHEVILGLRRPCDPAEVECPIATTRVSGQPESCQKLLEDRDGNRVPCIITAHPIHGSGGELLEVVLTRRESLATDEVWHIVRQQTEDLTLVHTLSELANRGSSRDEILELLSRSLREAFSANYATIYLLDPSRERLTLAHSGVPTKVIKVIERILQGPIPEVTISLERAPLTMAALLRGEATRLDDREGLLALMAENTDNALVRRLLTPILEAIGMRCGVMIPMRLQAQPMGLLCVGRREPITEPELRRLERIAEQVAGIVTQRQLQDDNRRLLRRQAMLLQAVAEAVLGLNREGEVVFANAAAASLLGRSQGQLHGTNIHLHCGKGSQDGRACAAACTVATSLQDRRARYDQEGVVRTRDGEMCPVRISAVPLGEPELNLVITMRDISEQVHHRKAEQRATERLRRSFSGTVAALRRLAEMRDPYTAGHERRVAQLARAIAQHMDLDEDVVDVVRLAATIHDIGKHAIPVEILTKPGRLTRQELELIRTHAAIGWEIVTEADFPDPIATVVRQHHERLDGSGYPDGISGDAITMEARIIAVADVVEAMASHRPYRASLGLEDALFEIQRNKGIHYDPQAVSACVAVFRSDGFTFE
jgi:putative nucleotidyltransferase with HDIG domain/PAS domain S-box-containing protein